jgi:acyl-CoA thioester hydrolase
MTSAAKADPLRGFPTVVIVNVAWGELDALGHVNNTVYFRYFEDARIAYLDAVGFGGATAGTPSGVGPILHSTMCRFRQPLGYPDMLKVGARASEVGDDRFTMEYRVISTKLGAVAAEGVAVVVAFDYSKGEKCALPVTVRTRIASLEHGVVADRTERRTPPSRRR